MARIGVAQCDPDGILATPVETIRVVDGPAADGPGWQAEVRRVLELVEEYFACGVVIGVPTSLKGTDTSSTTMARDFGAALQAGVAAGVEDTEVLFSDERLSTVQATAALHQAGRTSRQQRSIIDQQAAVVILQNWIDSQRATP